MNWSLMNDDGGDEELAMEVSNNINSINWTNPDHFKWHHECPV